MPLSVVRAIVLVMLAILFIAAGIAHFTVLRVQYVAIVPKALPYPQVIVQITGVLEVLGGVGLLVPFAARLAGVGLMLFLVAVFPANVEAARLNVPFSNPLWLRAVVQVVLIGAIAWTTLSSKPNLF